MILSNIEMLIKITLKPSLSVFNLSTVHSKNAGNVPSSVQTLGTMGKASPESAGYNCLIMGKQPKYIPMFQSSER